MGRSCGFELVCAHDGTCQDPGTGVNGPRVEGEECTRTDDCGYGLVCGPARTCIPGGVTAEGQGCGTSEECRYSLVCNSQYICARPGSGTEGTACLGAEECLSTLVCASDGTCQNPDSPDAVGVAGPGEACESTQDCRLGLVCFLDGTCQPLEFWTGLDCSRSEEAQEDPAVPFKVYFEVPREGEVDEFYRLPFPNDIRLKDGRVDLSGHPAPDTPLAAGLVGAYLQAIQDEAGGFSTQGTVLLRFSKRVDFSTITMSGTDPNFFIKDITPGSPSFGWGAAVFMFATTARGKYICQNWMGLKPQDGRPLRHATTYAVIVTTGILSTEGEALVRDDDFEAVISDQQPTDATLQAAWRAYQPLRDYLAGTGGLKDRVMAAAVFTTMDPDALMIGFGDKIRACTGPDCSLLPAPHPADLTLVSEESLFYQVSGSVDVPVFQEGTAPYLDAGGGVAFDAGGVPVIQRAERVAFKLSVPKGTPPAEGWPVVLFAHGTGGSPSSFITNGVAEKLAAMTVDLGGGPQIVGMAVLGIEGVQHGDRRGGSDLSPDVLYFNFLNPRAAKYNAVQGAADNFQLVRMIESLNASPATVSGIPDPVRLDPARIFYFGHSQGCLTGPLFLAYSPDVKTAVFSGAGGNLVLSLLTKTQPVDIAGATRLVLSDTNVGNMHPMLNLLQLYFDPVDVVNYGGGLTHDPYETLNAGPNHIFMSFGRDDHYSTEETQISFARSMNLYQVDAAGFTCRCHDDCDGVGDDGLHQSLCRVEGLTEATAPVRANAQANNQPFTAALKMYLPDATDGHFVLFDHPDGPDDYAGFLGSALADPEGIPTLFP